MKAIRLIFALYILYLSVYPCSDKDTCMDERKSGIAFVDTQDHEHSESEQDLCTPFCICACCSSTIQTPTPFEISSPIKEFITQNSVDISQSIKTFPHSVWQPPKLA